MVNSSVVESQKKASGQFTHQLFQEVVEDYAGEGVTLSAFSVIIPLMQLAIAAAGATREQIIKSLRILLDEFLTKGAFPHIDLEDKLGSVKGDELEQPNKVFIKSGFKLNENLVDKLQTLFDSEVQSVDFSNKIRAAEQINKWVAEFTNKWIKDLVDPINIVSDTVTILANDIYFEGKWKYSFKKLLTAERRFHGSNNTSVLTPTIHSKEYFKYGHSSELGAKFLELPCAGDETSFIIVLPDKVDGIDALIDKFKIPEALTRGLQTMSTENVDLALPKFNIETTTDLKEALKNMGVVDLFSSDLAQLENLIKGETNLYVSGATQKAVIEVDESGVDAAVANEFTVSRWKQRDSTSFTQATVVELPRLKIKTITNLKQASLNMEGTTSNSNANDGLQEVNEEGAEAAEFAAVPKSLRSKLTSFKADHPFLIFIMWGKYILFNGVFDIK
ncbi:serine protease inhibitor 3/4-like [Anticarsia gemmatalis]|uniref:serine protease inhibitor 3/4-like n=1 Tax=Anticarsia gemmatalis TaxID=129554 RepID=UPI003F7753EE